MASAAETSPRSGWTAYAPLDANTWTRLEYGWADIREGLGRHRAWRYLAVEQVKNSYRRTVLGPWWLTAQSAVYVLGLGFVFGQLLGAQLRQFLPYVAVGYLTYALLLGLVRAGAQVFVGSAGVIKSTRQPLSGLVLRAVTVEAIQFAHNAVIMLALFAFGLIKPTPWLLLAPVALALILFNGVCVGLWLGPVVARFRDVGPAVDSVLQVLIFFTPVFYKKADLHGAQAALVGWNPFTYFIDFFRTVVLGDPPSLGTLLGVSLFTVANVVAGAVVFARWRSHLPYWVS